MRRSLQCVWVYFFYLFVSKREKSGERQRQRSDGVGPAAHFQRAVWHSLEGMRGWITLLAATATFQSGPTLSSPPPLAPPPPPPSNPHWNGHLCKMKMRPEVRCNICFFVYSCRVFWVILENKLPFVRKWSLCRRVWLESHIWTHRGAFLNTNGNLPKQVMQRRWDETNLQFG